MRPQPQSGDVYIFWRDAGVDEISGPVAAGFVILGQELGVLGLRFRTLEEAKTEAVSVAKAARVSVWYGETREDDGGELLATFREDPA